VRFSKETKRHDGLSNKYVLMELLFEFLQTGCYSYKLAELYDYKTRISIVKELDDTIKRVNMAPLGVKVLYFKEGVGKQYKVSSIHTNFLLQVVNICENWEKIKI
jgi:hypothetical protein